MPLHASVNRGLHHEGAVHEPCVCSAALAVATMSTAISCPHVHIATNFDTWLKAMPLQFCTILILIDKAVLKPQTRI